VGLFDPPVFRGIVVDLNARTTTVQLVVLYEVDKTSSLESTFAFPNPHLLDLLNSLIHDRLGLIWYPMQITFIFTRGR
jgi:hypothetical protein